MRDRGPLRFLAESAVDGVCATVLLRSLAGRPSFPPMFKVPPVQPWKAAADLAVNDPQIALPVCANRSSDIRKRLAPAFSGDHI